MKDIISFVHSWHKKIMIIWRKANHHNSPRAWSKQYSKAVLVSVSSPTSWHLEEAKSEGEQLASFTTLICSRCTCKRLPLFVSYKYNATFLEYPYLLLTFSGYQWTIIWTSYELAFTKKELEIPYSSGIKSTRSKCSKNAPIVNVKWYNTKMTWIIQENAQHFRYRFI